jgi:glycosyltransferase involved in cell wall biosynthesis
MMRTVYINGRFLTQPLTGVQRYALEIVKSINDLASHSIGRLPKIELLVPRGTPLPDFSHIQSRTIGRSSGHLWDQIDFAVASRSGVALCLASTGPIFHHKCLVTIHDAAVFRVPDAFSTSYKLGHKVLGFALSRIANLATVSDFSRGELALVFGIDAQRIIVAPNGHEHMTLEPDEAIIRKLGLVSRPYFLMVGSLTRNKNLGTAVRAIEQLSDSDAALVAVGNHNASVFEHVPLPKSRKLIRAGRLCDREISALMRNATAFVFPSIYEGFGIAR